MTGDLVFCTQDGNRLGSRIVVREKRLGNGQNVTLLNVKNHVAVIRVCGLYAVA